jgi:hypothetical protein
VNPEVIFENGVAVGVITGAEGAREVRRPACHCDPTCGHQRRCVRGCGGAVDALQAAKAPLVIGDPTYFPAAKSRRTGRVIRAICILDHPVAAVKGLDSAQIIIPQNQIGRRHGMRGCSAGLWLGLRQFLLVWL